VYSSTFSESHVSIELNLFLGASRNGYGRCTYIRFVDETSLRYAFLMGNAKVASLKATTIPRLELTAEVLMSGQVYSYKKN
jgi:hypothetical protein